MAVPRYGGCPWPIDPACKTAEWNALDDDVQDRSLAMASLTLQRLTGWRVGGCPLRVRPQPSTGFCWIGTGSWLDSSQGVFSPRQDNKGEWRNCGVAPNPCEVYLPAPVTELQEVWIGGVRRDYDEFRIDNGHVLVYMGPDECPFPETNNLNADRDDPSVFEVIFLNTYPVDAVGAYAVGILAMEFAKACIGSNKCRLPTGVTSVARQGINIEIIAGSFPDGFTGIREVDAFIAAWNPRGMKQAPTVWSPGKRERLNTAAGLPGPWNDYIGGSP